MFEAGAAGGEDLGFGGEEVRRASKEMLDFWFGTAESGEAGEDAIRDLGLGLELSVALKLPFSGEFGAVGREMASAQDRGGLSGRIWHYMLGIGGLNATRYLHFVNWGNAQHAHTVPLGAEAGR